MDYHKLFDKVGTVSINGKANLQKSGGRGGVQKELQEAPKGLSLLSGNLDGFTDHLLTLHQGLHVSLHKPDDSRPLPALDNSLLTVLLESGDGHDVTPYGEDTYSIDKADRGFKSVAHGQARFKKFNIVDTFGQVISPLHRPKESQNFYPCIGRSISCQTNEAEGGNFANGVELDDENCSQFFQLGHRINQDARLNTYFAVNSAEPKGYHESTQYVSGERNLGRGQIEHFMTTDNGYKFEVLLGDKSNLHDGLIGYFPPAPGSTIKDPVEARKNSTAVVADSFASPSSSKVFVSPLHVNPADYPDDPAGYQRAICNHPSIVILGAIIDPYMPVHIATGILPSTALKLPQWIIDQTLKKLRLLLRGGPVLTRGDLPGAETSAASSEQPPLNQTTAEAYVLALTDKGEWSWLQPVVPEYAEPGDDDVYLPKFVPYNLKAAPSDYLLEMGPHTVLEGFYKYGLFEMKDNAKLFADQPPAEKQSDAL
ncbi:hypothetical protein V8C42DRAFT_356670 [Trichoderma barbatum]